MQEREKEYRLLLGKLIVGQPLSDAEAQTFADTLYQFECLLDSADHDDYFGTEGWRHMLGWD